MIPAPVYPVEAMAGQMFVVKRDGRSQDEISIFLGIT